MHQVFKTHSFLFSFFVVYLLVKPLITTVEGIREPIKKGND